MRRSILACLAALRLLLAGMTEPARADIPAVTISDLFGDQQIDGDFTLGWSFHTNAAVTATML
jgi:hypothetical protein